MFLKLFPRYAGRAHRGLGSGLVVSDPSLGLSADVRAEHVNNFGTLASCI